MNQIERRICALETADSPEAGQLPTILPDDAPDSELERLRGAGVMAYRSTVSRGSRGTPTRPALRCGMNKTGVIAAWL